MGEELDVLKLVAERLTLAGIPYMVAGSMAVNYYATPRMTRDIDVVVELSHEGIAVRKDTDYRREEFARRRRVTVEGIAILLAAPEDLILSKLEWAKDSRSEMPLDDVRNLLASVPDLDKDYPCAMGRPTESRSVVSRGVLMKDTSPEIERRFREMLLARSGEERLKMGCSMHQFAQMMVRASVLAKHPQATPADLRRELLLRFYGRDLNPDRLRTVLSALEGED